MTLKSDPNYLTLRYFWCECTTVHPDSKAKFFLSVGRRHQTKHKEILQVPTSPQRASAESRDYVWRRSDFRRKASLVNNSHRTTCVSKAIFRWYESSGKFLWTICHIFFVGMPTNRGDKKSNTTHPWWSVKILTLWTRRESVGYVCGVCCALAASSMAFGRVVFSFILCLIYLSESKTPVVIGKTERAYDLLSTVLRLTLLSFIVKQTNDTSNHSTIHHPHKTPFHLFVETHSTTNRLKGRFTGAYTTTWTICLLLTRANMKKSHDLINYCTL